MKKPRRPRGFLHSNESEDQRVTVTLVPTETR